jgi:hypothetical protein
MYLFLLAAAVVAGSALGFLDAGVVALSSAMSLGETIGRVGALFLLAALVPTLMVLLCRKPIASAASPTAVGMVVMIAFAYLSYHGIEAQRTLASLTLPAVAGPAFSPPACEFVVVFPSEPKMTSVIVPGFGEVPEAEISDDRGLMRANCISVANHGSAQTIPYYQDRQLLLRTIQAHAEQNGLSTVSYLYDKIDLASAPAREEQNALTTGG